MTNQNTQSGDERKPPATEQKPSEKIPKPAKPRKVEKRQRGRKG
jgi:hypothetical protein